MEGLSALIGRLLLAHIFVLSGVNKLMDIAGTQKYMESAGVPVKLLPLVIAVELGGGLMVVLGWHARLAAVLLAGFSVLAAVFFHANFTEQMQMINFMKNLAIAGGFLMLAAHGPGPVSMDRGRSHRGRGLDLR